MKSFALACVLLLFVVLPAAAAPPPPRPLPPRRSPDPDLMALRLPRLPGVLAAPAQLTSLPAPFLALAGRDRTNWLGRGLWVGKPDQSLLVKQATTRIIEQGPVRVTVRYRLLLKIGRAHV